MPENEKDRVIHVLDAGVFIKPEGRGFSEKTCVTTYAVMEELQSLEAKVVFDMFLKKGMALMHPAEEKMKEVERYVEELGERVSGADISVVALALELRDKGRKVVVVTDDYSVQNLCSFCEIEFVPVATRGIKERVEWVKKCIHCNIVMEGEECPRCGMRDFKFVPYRKKRLR